MQPSSSLDKTPALRLIAKFGGISGAAKALRLARSTVQRWAEFGYIRPRYHPKILSEAASRNITLEVGDFLAIDLSHPAFGSSRASGRGPKRHRARPRPPAGGT